MNSGETYRVHQLCMAHGVLACLCLRACGQHHNRSPRGASEHCAVACADSTCSTHAAGHKIVAHTAKGWSRRSVCSRHHHTSAPRANTARSCAIDIHDNFRIPCKRIQLWSVWFLPAKRTVMSEHVGVSKTRHASRHRTACTWQNGPPSILLCKRHLDPSQFRRLVSRGVTFV